MKTQQHLSPPGACCGVTNKAGDLLHCLQQLLRVLTNQPPGDLRTRDRLTQCGIQTLAFTCVPWENLPGASGHYLWSPELY